MNTHLPPAPDSDPQETSEWLEALDGTAAHAGTERAGDLIDRLVWKSNSLRLPTGSGAITPYQNTIGPEADLAYPGDEALEEKIENIIRWNAMAMVVRANTAHDGLGGHMSTFASAATLYEVGQQHFFRGLDHPGGGDLIFFQGHASPGMYARAFLEGRIDTDRLDHFRREVGGRGLSSYPHPRLMPDFWQFPTVSLGPAALHAL